MTNKKKKFRVTIDATLRWEGDKIIEADSKGEASAILFSDLLMDWMVKYGDLDSKVQFTEMKGKRGAE